jgi:ABC-type lipoprotein release transport system permease subunit
MNHYGYFAARAVLVESIKVALRSLGVHRLRSALTMLGIMIGVAAVIVMLAVGTGAQERITAQIRSLGSNVIGISPGSTAMKSVRLGSGTTSRDQILRSISARLDTRWRDPVAKPRHATATRQASFSGSVVL